MDDFRTRLDTELDELTTKVKKLEDFLLTDKFKELGPDQCSLMQKQLVVMREYGIILQQRLALLNEADEAN